MLFNVTYEIVTDESAEDGEAAERGYVAQDMPLREAIDLVNESNHCSQECIEANDSRLEHARWITVYNSRDYLSGAFESRSLHFPDSPTAASRVRIARLMGCR